MLTVLIVILRSIGLICRGHRAVALENLALRVGAPRIHGELCKLGLTASERTVSRLLRQPQRRSSQTWRTFLTNHVGTLMSMDFFTVSTPTGRVLFVLVLLAPECQRIIHINFTEHPTAAWTAQQMVEALSWGANTSGLGEGRADATTRSDADGRACGRVPGSGRITSSLRTTRRVIGTSRC